MEQCRGLDRLAGSGGVSTPLVLLGLQKLPQLFTIWVKIGKMDGGRVQGSVRGAKCWRVIET